MRPLTKTYEVGAESEETARWVAILQGAEELFYSPGQMRVIEVQVIAVGEDSALYKIQVAGPA